MTASKRKALKALKDNKDQIFANEDVVFAGVRKGEKDYKVSVYVKGSDTQLPKAPNTFKKAISNSLFEIKYTEPFDAYSFTNKETPVMSGLSISNINLEPGTFSTLVEVKGELFILGCWHVMTGLNGKVGDIIRHPGRNDSVTFEEIGELVWYAITSKLDIALAKPKDLTGLSYDSKCFGAISQVGRILENLKVKKCGRTTEATFGKILYTDAIVRVSHRQYPGGSKIFDNQIIAEINCKPGDSGALLLDDKNQVIGLLVGGNTGFGFFNKYNEIVKTFKKL